MTNKQIVRLFALLILLIALGGVAGCGSLNLQIKRWATLAPLVEA